jgi:HTH-type transcriptional regulator/antitoxin HigA
MDIKPIRTKADYRAALAEIERLFDAAPGTPDGDRLDVWTTLVEAYEARHEPIPLPDPIEAILYHMESRRLSHADLEPYIGSRARVAEVLNRKRPLSMAIRTGAESRCWLTLCLFKPEAPHRQSEEKRRVPHQHQHRRQD